jgi:alpha-D-ribose 1-methylphosphonate 5-phosphate C-P lyase
MKLKEWMNTTEHRGQNAGVRQKGYNFAFIDEGAKREIRRKILKAVAIPGYQVPFGSRELPIAMGW